MKTQLPFSGFFCSIWFEGVRREEEMLIESIAQEHDIKVELYQFSNYDLAYDYIAREYPKYLSETLGVELTFTDMRSPRQYNFETDRIFADIETKDAYKLYRQVGKKLVREKAKELFTSRDGFISYYSPNIDDWGQLRTWDCNQVQCVLEAWLEKYKSNWEFEIYEKMSEVISAAYKNSVNWKELYIEVGRLLERTKQQEERSDRVYPVIWKDTEDYVMQYYKLNGFL